MACRPIRHLEVPKNLLYSDLILVTRRDSLTNPLISIVIPTYNRAAYLKRALDSVLTQTFKLWECIVCDDGSTDETEELVHGKSLSDSRFRLVKGERFGLPAGPRNRGIKEAKGEWIAFLDDDDLWHPLKLERQWEMIESSACNAVSVRSEPFIDGHFAGFGDVQVGRSATKLNLVDILIQRQPYPSTPATTVKREVLIQCGGFSESPTYRAVEDFDLWCRLLSIPDFIWLIDDGEPLVAYRDQGEDSISSWNKTYNPQVIRQRWAMLECRNRVVMKSCKMRGTEKRLILEELLREADDCAWRSNIVGWRATAANAYALAALYAALLHRPGEIGLRFIRAFRLLPRSDTQLAAPLPEEIPALARRTTQFAFNILRGHSKRAMPIPIDRTGRWSSLSPVVS